MSELILIVDDEPGILTTLGGILSDEGYCDPHHHQRRGGARPLRGEAARRRLPRHLAGRPRRPRDAAGAARGGPDRRGGHDVGPRHDRRPPSRRSRWGPSTISRSRSPTSGRWTPRPAPSPTGAPRRRAPRGLGGHPRPGRPRDRAEAERRFAAAPALPLLAETRPPPAHHPPLDRGLRPRPALRPAHRHGPPAAAREQRHPLRHPAHRHRDPGPRPRRRRHRLRHHPVRRRGEHQDRRAPPLGAPRLRRQQPADQGARRDPGARRLGARVLPDPRRGRHRRAGRAAARGGHRPPLRGAGRGREGAGDRAGGRASRSPTCCATRRRSASSPTSSRSPRPRPTSGRSRRPAPSAS